MSDSLMAISGGVMLIAFVVVPLGCTRTPGEERKPLTWSNWLAEAAFSLWIFSPLNAAWEVWIGHSKVSDALVISFAWLAVLSGVVTGLGMIGFGFYLMWLP